MTTNQPLHELLAWLRELDNQLGADWRLKGWADALAAVLEPRDKVIDALTQDRVRLAAEVAEQVQMRNLELEALRLTQEHLQLARAEAAAARAELEQMRAIAKGMAPLVAEVVLTEPTDADR